jgi:hypothetical protein
LSSLAFHHFIVIFLLLHCIGAGNGFHVSSGATAGVQLRTIANQIFERKYVSTSDAESIKQIYPGCFLFLKQLHHHQIIDAKETDDRKQEDWFCNVPVFLPQLLEAIAFKSDVYVALHHQQQHQDQAAATATVMGSELRPPHLPSRCVSPDQDQQRGRYFPGARRGYVSIEISNRKTINKSLSAITADCFKGSKRHPELLPGVFAFVCPHGMVLGFFFMLQPESCQSPVDVLYTRRDMPPAIVVYDNSCHAAEFGLCRFPSFFSHTKFVSDSLHSHNHTSCTTGSKMTSFTEAGSSVGTIFSVIAEQQWPHVKGLKVPLLPQSLSVAHTHTYAGGRSLHGILPVCIRLVCMHYHSLYFGCASL